jgi:hypothetical protein
MWIKGKMMMSDVTSRNSENSNKPKSLPSSLVKYEQEDDENNGRVSYFLSLKSHKILQEIVN